MAKGTRLRLLSQAVASMPGESFDPEDFVETGRLGGESQAGDVLPFNQDVRTEIVKHFEGK